MAIISFYAFYMFGHRGQNTILFIETPHGSYYYNLDQHKKITVLGAGGETIIEITNGQFHFIQSTCQHKDCIKMGWVSMSNFPVICLPNKVSAYIVNKENEPAYHGISQWIII